MLPDSQEGICFVALEVFSFRGEMALPLEVPGQQVRSPCMLAGAARVCPTVVKGGKFTFIGLRCCLVLDSRILEMQLFRFAIGIFSSKHMSNIDITGFVWKT